eukprot:12881524-Alexandrium_andersonii.AAC.1
MPCCAHQLSKASDDCQPAGSTFSCSGRPKYWHQSRLKAEISFSVVFCCSRTSFAASTWWMEQTALREPSS